MKLIRVIVLVLLEVLAVPRSFAMSCKFTYESLEQKVQSAFLRADIVAVGTFVSSSQFSHGNFSVEGIWKGPDFEMLDVFMLGTPDAGTRAVVFGMHDPGQDNAYSDFSMVCYGPRILGKLGYAEIAAKTEELFGPPRKPDMYVSRSIFVFGLIVLFLALAGMSLVVMKQVSLNKSFKRDAYGAP